MLWNLPTLITLSASLPLPSPSLYDYLCMYIRTYIHTCTVKCTGQASGCPVCLTRHSKGTSKAPQTVGVIATLQVNWRPATKERMQYNMMTYVHTYIRRNKLKQSSHTVFYTLLKLYSTVKVELSSVELGCDKRSTTMYVRTVCRQCTWNIRTH